MTYQYPLEKNSIEDILYVVYDNFTNYYTNTEYLRQRAIVILYNETVDLINAYVLDLLPRIMKTYYSCDLIS